ncbi:alkanesulfonate monooxygenase SsuD/methylene tetrahydromethanopterin reductase-like flavin-dependent oxidoreductase (luciferase family) [Rhodococcus sp. 27YEA15]|uniref:LLM class flavin-dependent oxidoreductase n=1 Tax=Rhodococcus sp. 27YEA15 TaxID=3156259 RepID=UPI003C7B8413
MSTMNHSIKIGVVLPGREAAVDSTDYPEKIPQLAARAEQLGFDSLWAGESPLARSRMNPLLSLAAAAAVTTDITLGTAVLMPLRPPVQLAHELACLDRMSNGRIVAGLGSGFASSATEREFSAYGLSFQDRARSMTESAEICRRLWQAQSAPVTFEGKIHEIRDVSLLPRTTRTIGIPLWIAHSSPRMSKSIGEKYDGWMPTSTSPEKYRAGWELILAAGEAASRAHDSVTPALYLSVASSTRTKVAEATLSAYFGAYYGLPLATMRTTQGILGGTIDQVAEQVQKYVDAGARHVVFRLATEKLDYNSYADALDEVGSELVPLLRELQPQ